VPRHILVAAFCFLLVSACERPPEKPVTLNMAEDCQSAGQSPICAVKTLQACRAFEGDQSLCAAIGVDSPGRTPNYGTDLTPPGPEPWKLTWDELASRQKFCSYNGAALERVSPDRFKSETAVPRKLVGTHEFVLIVNNCQPGYKVYSFFTKRESRGWVITSFDDWYVAEIYSDTDGPIRGSDCDVDRNDNDAFCSMHAAGIAKYSPDEIMKEEWRSKPVLTTEQIAASCQAEVGEIRATEIAWQCRQMSGATRPPCHPMNPCAVMHEVIKDGCIGYAEYVKQHGDALPDFCSAYMPK
jgi:hypothetical protein